MGNLIMYNPIKTTSSTTNQGSVPLTLRGNLTNNFSIEVVGNHGAPSGFEYLSGTSTDWGIAMSYEGASGHNCEVTLGTSYYQAMGGTVPTNTPVLTACVFNSALASNRLTSYINSTAAATNNAAAASLRTGTNAPYIYSFGYTAWQTRNAFNGIAEVTRISDMYRTPTDNSSIRSNMFLPFSNPLTITTSQ